MMSIILHKKTVRGGGGGGEREDSQIGSPIARRRALISESSVGTAIDRA